MESVSGVSPVQPVHSAFLLLPVFVIPLSEHTLTISNVMQHHFAHHLSADYSPHTEGSESCFTNGHLCALTTTGEHDSEDRSCCASTNLRITAAAAAGVQDSSRLPAPWRGASGSRERGSSVAWQTSSFSLTQIAGGSKEEWV